MNTVKADRIGNSTLISNISGTTADLSAFDPSDLLAASLAKCTLGTVTRLTEREAMSIDQISVRVDLSKNGEDRKANFTVHVDVDGDLQETDLKTIEKIARKSYIRRLLGLDIMVDGHIHYNGDKL